MNCEKGDLAIIVESVNRNEGKIVRCLRFVGKVEGWQGFDRWEIDIVVTGKYGGKSKTYRDSWLRPIRGNPGDDETLQWLDVPSTTRVTA